MPILDEITAYLGKRKNVHFKTISQEEIMNFTDFRQNGSVFKQKNPALKINEPQGKFIIQQLISNFADFWWKNNVLMQNEQSFKNISHKKKFITQWVLPDIYWNNSINMLFFFKEKKSNCNQIIL